MKAGTMVEVVEFGGRRLKRRVVADQGRIVVICNEEEYRRATRERREPKGIGFPRESVKQAHGKL